jgi:hypothetical protein
MIGTRIGTAIGATIGTVPLTTRIADIVSIPWSGVAILRLDVVRYARRQRALATPPERMLVQLRAVLRPLIQPGLVGPNRAWAAIVLSLIVSTAVDAYFDDLPPYVPR